MNTLTESEIRLRIDDAINSGDIEVDDFIKPLGDEELSEIVEENLSTQEYIMIFSAIAKVITGETDGDIKLIDIVNQIPADRLKNIRKTIHRIVQDDAYDRATEFNLEAAIDFYGSY